MLTERENEVILAINQSTEENNRCPQGKDIVLLVDTGASNCSKILNRLIKKGSISATNTYYKQYAVLDMQALKLAQEEEFKPPKLYRLFANDPWGIWED